MVNVPYILSVAQTTIKQTELRSDTLRRRTRATHLSAAPQFRATITKTCRNEDHALHCMMQQRDCSTAQAQILSIMVTMTASVIRSSTASNKVSSRVTTAFKLDCEPLIISNTKMTPLDSSSWYTYCGAQYNNRTSTQKQLPSS